MTHDLHNIILHLPAAVDDTAVAAFAPALTERALAASQMRDDRDHRHAWTLNWLMEQQPDAAEIKSLLNDAALQAGLSIGSGDWRIEPVADVNWLEHSYKQFQPFAVGEFFIYGSHYADTPPQNKLLLQIDAATAFGSGEHGTTAGCLQALLSLKQQGFSPQRILDMGTGSGILAVAAARLWDAPVLAVDIEEESVIVTARHAAMNGVAAKIDARHGDGFNTPDVGTQAPFDLVIANILAGPLVSMAVALCAVTARAGQIILSGMLVEQAQEVQAAYERQGCTLRQNFSDESWTTLLLQKPA